MSAEPEYAEQRVVVPAPVVPFDEEGARRLARAYWRYLSKISLGLIRVVYAQDSTTVVLVSDDPLHFDGADVAIANDGRAKLILFLAHWCPHCQEQKRLFGASEDRLPYVECSPGGPRGGVASSCVSAGVTTYPTWIFPDGSRVTAVISLRELAERVRSASRHDRPGSAAGRPEFSAVVP